LGYFEWNLKEFGMNTNEINELNIYPTPAYDFIKIDLHAKPECEFRILIIDNKGEVRLEKMFSANKTDLLLTLSTNEPSTGYYFCVVKFGDKTLSKRFLILK
jgi:hypothetical protein